MTSHKRSDPTLAVEQNLWSQGYERVAALDEVGRGALAGPVVAAAVILPVGIAADLLYGVRDSKQLSAAQRQRLVPQICSFALAVGIGSASAQEIDRINIRRATALAMQRALKDLAWDHLLVDGLAIPELGTGQTPVIRGDAQCLAIACASILAKVTRVGWMQILDQRFRGYGWAKNAGYGTLAHRTALAELGPTPQHRRSFKIH